MKTILSLIFLCISLLASDSLEKVSLELKWKYQFQFAGFIAAKEKGFYQELGLDVDLIEFTPPVSSIDDLKNKKIDFAIADSALILNALQGEPIKAVMALYQSSPFVLIGLKSSKITTLEDINQKKIALFGSPNGMTIEAMLASRQVDFKREPANNKFNRLLNNEVDLITGYISNEPFLIKEKGIDITIIDPKDYGFDSYGDILFTSKETIKNRPDVVAKMYEGTKKGFQYAYTNIDEMVEIIFTKYNTQHKSREALLYEANTLKKMILIDENFGNIELDKVKNIAQLYSFMTPGNFDVKYLNDFIYQKEKNSLYLTQKELNWIKKHPLLSYSEFNLKPFPIIENNKLNGIEGDYLDIISQRTGLKFKFIPTTSRLDALKKFKEKKIDFIPGVNAGEKEKELGLISNVYKKYPVVIVTGSKYKFVENLHDFDGKTIAVPKHHISYNYLVKNYPKINLKATSTVQEALLLVQAGKVDAFLGHIADSLYYISHLQLSDLRVTKTTDLEFMHSQLIQEESPELLSIVNKVFKSITEKEKANIDANWINPIMKEKLDYTVVWQILGIASIIVFLFMYRNFELSKYNKKLKYQKDLLYHQAHTDVLTKLPNRALFDDRLEQSILRAKRHKEKFSLFFLDLDKFKQINDTLGHDIGDKLLQHVASRLKHTIRANDTIARLGGDEFTIIANDLSNTQDVSIFAEKILNAITEPLKIDEHTLSITFSIGISIYPHDGEDADTLLKNADIAMYKAKDKGKNNYQFFSSNNSLES